MLLFFQVYISRDESEKGVSVYMYIYKEALKLFLLSLLDL